MTHLCVPFFCLRIGQMCLVESEGKTDCGSVSERQTGPIQTRFEVGENDSVHDRSVRGSVRADRHPVAVNVSVRRSVR